jgi:hypothetical protein
VSHSCNVSALIGRLFAAIIYQIDDEERGV